MRTAGQTLPGSRSGDPRAGKSLGGRLMTRIAYALGAAGLLLAAGLYPMLRGQEAARPGPVGRGTVFAVDNGGRPVESLEVGSSLLVGARGLEPRRVYEFRLGLDQEDPQSYREALSFARGVSDARGGVPSLVLWYGAGGGGWSQRGEAGEKRPRLPVPAV